MNDEFEQWLTGFWEGDGGIDRIESGPRFNFTQPKGLLSVTFELIYP